MSSALPQRHVQFSGPLLVSAAPTIQAQIVEALDMGGPVCLDVSQATDIDISFLQILVAAQKTATDEGKRLTISDHGAERLRDQIGRCGLPSTALPTFSALTL